MQWKLLLTETVNMSTGTFVAKQAYKHINRDMKTHIHHCHFKTIANTRHPRSHSLHLNLQVLHSGKNFLSVILVTHTHTRCLMSFPCCPWAFFFSAHVLYNKHFEPKLVLELQSLSFVIYIIAMRLFKAACSIKRNKILIKLVQEK